MQVAECKNCGHAVTRFAGVWLHAKNITANGATVVTVSEETCKGAEAVSLPKRAHLSVVV